MNDTEKESLITAYNQNPNLVTLSPLVALHRSQNKIDSLRSTLLNHYEQFSLSEQLWLDWLSDEFKANPKIYETLLPLALSNFPLSSSLHRLRLANSVDKISAIELSVQTIGEFDNSF
jgi:hypothetical protein